ncbi:hypothetical protein WOLCODRAFT_165417 [Wolfiporia cocos MD-104 SS10]|uniref:F-box domain-containing protein n=1 Tax=Wolfiporia cocos (strain MD-104) TaxID=742152 RepID=A0A2H3JRN4_WOLCO|nr:hypothetical protein WOLCODRAFT_165417 [Wolfiporia cocos MD-104 SS10]
MRAAVIRYRKYDIDVFIEIDALQRKVGKSSVDKQRRALNHHVNWHSRFILQLKREINKLSPISVLPPEILEKIFITHTKIVWQETDAEWKQSLSLDVTQELIARFKALPLTIRLDFDWEDSDLSLPLILWEFERIRQLEIFANLSDVPYRLLCSDEEISGSPTPLLQQLLRNTRNYDTYTNDERLRVIASTLSSHASSPQLTRLVLHSWPFDWAQITPLSMLRHLDITFERTGQSERARERRDGKAEFDALLVAVKLLPLLESLCIRGCFLLRRDSFEWNVIPNRMVTLSHLRHLCLKDGASACATTLSHLTLPVLSTLNVNIADGHDLEETDAERVLVHLAHGIIEQVRGMGEAHSVNMCRSSLRVSYVAGPNQQASGKLYIYFGDLRESCEVRLCPELSSTVAAMTVRDVSVDGGCLLYMDVWGALIGRMPNATNLQVNSPSRKALEALGQPSIAAHPPSINPDRQEDELATGYPFPRLRFLTLVNPDFSWPSWMPD